MLLYNEILQIYILYQSKVNLLGVTQLTTFLAQNRHYFAAESYIHAIIPLGIQ